MQHAGQKPVAAKMTAMHLVLSVTDTARIMPEAEAAGAVFLGAAFVGDPDLLANSEPTALSKKPPPEEPATQSFLSQSDHSFDSRTQVICLFA